DGILLPAEQIPGERLTHGTRVRAYVVGVQKEGARVQVLLSRTHPELVRGLFELEVPEVLDGAVEIVAIAREAGHRSKVAVRSEEHTSELQSRFDLVCRLLLEKKKTLGMST